MGRLRVRAVLALSIAALAFAAGGVAASDEAPLPALSVRYGDSIAVKPGKLAGKVLFPDGTSPAAAVAVQAWSVEQEKYVCETVTDAEGAYELEGLPAGRHLLVVGGRVSVDVRVAEEADHRGPLNVIIPHGVGPFAQMPPEDQAAVLVLLAEGDAEQQEPVPRRPLRTVLIIGGGAATAIGTVVTIDELGDGHHGGGVVSP